jgi:hypothetical protein
LIGVSVERRHSRENDVSDNTNRPDIAFLIVLLIKNFGGDIIRGAELLIKGLSLLDDEGGSEIDNLDLIEVLVGFKEHVLGLEVSMDDVVLVTVVDASKDLLDKDSSVLLGELSSGDNLIKKLSSFADSFVNGELTQ